MFDHGPDERFFLRILSVLVAGGTVLGVVVVLCATATHRHNLDLRSRCEQAAIAHHARADCAHHTIGYVRKGVAR